LAEAEYAGGSDKQLSLPLVRDDPLAWADPDLRQRITFVLTMFGVFGLMASTSDPDPRTAQCGTLRSNCCIHDFDLINMFAAAPCGRMSIFALGLNPYITASSHQIL